MVEHGTDQQLCRDRGRAEVARQQAQSGGEPPARADARDHDAAGVDAQLLAVRGHPGQSSVAVLDGGGAGGLGREPVLHGDDDHAEPLQPLQRDVRLPEAVAHDHPAAVDPVDARCRDGRVVVRGTQHRQPDGGAVLGRDVHLPPDHAVAGEQGVGGGGRQGAQLGEDLLVHPLHQGHPGEEGAQFGVEGGARGHGHGCAFQGGEGGIHAAAGPKAALPRTGTWSV
ncbi:hypothetical protein GCM10010243_10760 [Streptomyces matensis]|nr:hypothetical protein GCM10010243_10760 [Streptomyces matensis]